MGVIDMCHEMVFNTAEEGFACVLSKGGKCTVMLCRSLGDERGLHGELSKLDELVRQYNTTVGCIEKQLLPTMPYFWDDILGCLAVKCAEVDFDTVENCNGKMAIFTGWNRSVLCKPVEMQASDKAMSSLALLGSLVLNGR